MGRVQSDECSVAFGICLAQREPSSDVADNCSMNARGHNQILKRRAMALPARKCKECASKDFTRGQDTISCFDMRNVRLTDTIGTCYDFVAPSHHGLEFPEC